MKVKRAAKEETHLAAFLKQTRGKHNLTIRKAASIAGVHPSVFGSWEKGSSPLLDSIPRLKQFCEMFETSLSTALTGEDDSLSRKEVTTIFDEHEFFDGYARIKIMRLLPKNGIKKKE